MGIDWGKLFGDAQDKIEDSLEDIIRVGKPALEVSLQQWGQDVLKEMQLGSQRELNEAVHDVTKNDPAPGTFGAALSATVQGTFLQTYGHYLLFGAIGLIILGFYLRGKK